MSIGPETNTITIPESSEQHLSRAFMSAEHELARCAFAVDDLFIAEGKGLDTIPASRYWLRVAEHVNRLVNEQYSEPHNLEYGKLLQMTALTPIGFLASKQSAAIDRIPLEQRTEKDRERRQRSVAIAARLFNSMVDYARGNDSLTTDALRQHVIDVLSRTLAFPEAGVLTHTSHLITGVQQEVAAGYILFDAIEARAATLEEDLEGADYVAFYRDNYGIMIDIKNSLSAIERAGGDQKIGWVEKNGKILTTSLITTEELGGKFRPTSALIRERSPEMKRMIAAAMRTPNLVLCTYDRTTWRT